MKTNILYTEDNIKRLIYSYGAVAMIAVLSEQEKVENYELCHDIIKSIKEVFKDDMPPTRYGEKLFNWVEKSYPIRDKGWFKPSLNLNVNNIYSALKLKRTYQIKLT